MKPRGNGLVELVDEKSKDRGFHCMDLIGFLAEDKVEDWDEWHGAYEKAVAGSCPYCSRCQRYARTVEQHGKRPIQLTLF